MEDLLEMGAGKIIVVITTIVKRPSDAWRASLYLLARQ
jgi:hypothetical protein